eukprot:Gregarina_sp_Poly_1__6657@NODE_3580_length_994_cov_411_969795_g1762_i2_p1_GENE_NODE_3580_length_994_cov_411_969795_g1762_i2NODE_3580_length_994_cov_411_969795_g1762_i2_p1_ORF_typecomplete_len106_score0_42_NODE_3580_length_994_cov_411_969795_g1762_i2138455
MVAQAIFMNEEFGRHKLFDSNSTQQGETPWRFICHQLQKSDGGLIYPHRHVRLITANCIKLVWHLEVSVQKYVLHEDVESHERSRSISKIQSSANRGKGYWGCEP